MHCGCCLRAEFGLGVHVGLPMAILGAHKVFQLVLRAPRMVVPHKFDLANVLQSVPLLVLSSSGQEERRR